MLKIIAYTLIWAMSVGCSYVLADKTITKFAHPTQYGKYIYFQWLSTKKPCFIKVEENIIFQTQANSRGNYDSFRWAGDLFPKGDEAPGSTQYGLYSKQKICLRWVIEVGFSPNKHYIIDFTDINPFVVGPFGQDDEPEGDVKRVVWGKRFATIQFVSTNKYYYEYKTRKILFQEEPE